MLASSIEKVLTRYGEMSFVHDDQYIGSSLRKYGEYSEAEVELWRKIVRPGDTVVDVGANIGALTLPLAQIVGSTAGIGGKVLAFEPQPENFQLLQRNVEANQLQDVITVANCALGEREGTINTLHLNNLESTNYGGIELGIGDVPVAVRTLDSFNLSEVRFVKVDVEGMEAAVLNGMRDTIRRCKPVLYVENDRKEKADELIRLLRSFGYRLYTHKPPLYSTSNFRKAPITDLLLVSNNLLCIPLENIEEFENDGVMDGLNMVVPASPRQGKTGWAGIVRLGGIGDNLIAAAVLGPLKRKGYKIDVISQEPQSCVYENNPYVDKLSVKMSARDLPQGDQWEWQKYWRARSYEYDVFANLSHSSEHLLAQFKASSVYWWNADIRRELCGKSYLELVCKIAKVPCEFNDPLFWPTDDEREQAIATKRYMQRNNPLPVIGWALTGTRVDKIYPQSAMAIGRLIKELGVSVIMFGAPAPYPDFVIAEEIQKTVKYQNGSDRGLYLGLSPQNVSSWPIRRILTQATYCDLLIGPDTGTMWGVAMEPIPKIMLLSHASAENITKHWKNTISLHADQTKIPCNPCHLLHDAIDTCQEMQKEAGLDPKVEDKGAACITSISVDLIMDAVKIALGGNKEDLQKLQKKWSGNVTL